MPSFTPQAGFAQLAVIVYWSGRLPAVAAYWKLHCERNIKMEAQCAFIRAAVTVGRKFQAAHGQPGSEKQQWTTPICKSKVKSR